MRQAAVLVVVVCALAGAALAAGAALLPAKNELLGGGTIGMHWVSSPKAGHPDVSYTTIRVDKKTGRSLHLYGEWTVPCSGRPAVTAVFDTVVPLKPDGTFTGRGTLPATDLIPKGMQYSFDGAFTSPTAARVTGAATFTFVENGKSSRCAGSGLLSSTLGS